jgi:hypothetical protein
VPRGSSRGAAGSSRCIRLIIRKNPSNLQEGRPGPRRRVRPRPPSGAGDLISGDVKAGSLTGCHATTLLAVGSRPCRPHRAGRSQNASPGARGHEPRSRTDPALPGAIMTATCTAPQRINYASTPAAPGHPSTVGSQTRSQRDRWLLAGVYAGIYPVQGGHSAPHAYALTRDHKSNSRCFSPVDSTANSREIAHHANISAPTPPASTQRAQRA